MDVLGWNIMEIDMKAPALAAALSATIALAACGEPIDGSDTADMTNDAVSADTGAEGESSYNPNEDGPLKSDALLEDADNAPDMADDEMMAEQPANTDNQY